MIELGIKFLLAHLLGDFVLQPSSWVENKKRKKIGSKYLYYHIGVHVLLLLAVTGFDLAYLQGIIIVAITHFLIDCSKLYLETSRNGKILFFADQLLHIVVLMASVCYYVPYTIDFSILYSSKIVLLATALVFTSYTVSVLLKILLERFTPETSPQKATNNAGKYIGILERLFIFFFVVINFWEGVGFLLAAKSIFRFGDLKESKDVKLTEYILIGTLLSFAFGILTALIYQSLLEHL